MTIKDILDEITVCLNAIDENSFVDAVDLINSSSRIFSAGQGRSGLAVRGFAMRLMHLGKHSYVIGETTTPSIKKDDLLILGSGSGKTESLIVMAKKAKSIGCKIILFTGNEQSSISSIADLTIKISAPVDNHYSLTDWLKSDTNASIQPMGTLFEQSLSIIFDSIVVELMNINNITSSEMFANHTNIE